MYLHLTSASGTIDLDGKYVQSPYISTNSDNAGNIFKIETQNGEIIMKSSASQESPANN